MSLSPGVSLLPLWGWGLTLTPSRDWACRWSSRMAQHTPSQMPTLGRSTSSRWLPRTMRLGRGATGAWLLTLHPGRRNHGISLPKPRPPVSLLVPGPTQPHPVLTPSSSSWEHSFCHTTHCGCDRPTHLPNTCVPSACFLHVLGRDFWVQYSLMRGMGEATLTSSGSSNRVTSGNPRSGWDPAPALP